MDGCPHNQRQVGDTTASDGDRHAASRTQTIRSARGGQLPRDLRLDIVQSNAGKRLANRH
jgi:hypothetical protein